MINFDRRILLMKNKGLTAVLMALSISAFLLAGCGNSTGDNITASSEADVSSETESTTETLTETVALEEADLSSSDVSEIYIEAIPDISDDFICGMDVSSILAEEKSGVKYYDFDGNEQDVFKTMADSGVNYARIRVWNDPYDENGNGYGGGNNDLETAIELGKRATRYGMKVCIDFHYSDFWADPKRQHAPKAWENMSTDEKCDALYEYTKDSLSQLIDAGVDVEMVQVGNEINNGMSGEGFLPNVNKLLVSGCSAVREISSTYNKDIQVAIHYTNIEDNSKIDSLVSNLENSGVDYDIIGLSYYPFWDGTNENMQRVAKNIQDKYGKKVMIAETSYAYTTEDGDGFGNSFDGIDGAVEGYPATVQGQASMIRDICAAANEADVIGIFYWEGAWIPVGSASSDNSAIWEKYGSGWASSYSADYDPEDAGLYYGGCSWDNQAMFDFTGHPLASLNVFKYLKTGCNAELSIDSFVAPVVTVNAGDEIVLPETVDVIYNDRSKNTSIPVEWYEEQYLNIDVSKEGTYEIWGRVMDDHYGKDEQQTEVSCTVIVKLDNLVINPSFEDSDTSMWKVTYEGKSNPTDYQVKSDDAYSGDVAFHFWSENDMEFSISQEFTDLEAGTYDLKAYFQGGDIDDNAEMELYAVSDDDIVYSASFKANGWANWQVPEISDINVTDGTLTIGVRIKCNAKGWGTVDDFTLNKVD
jgi:arabinogalactan endo-1,4-beta-galactosidase